MGEWLDTTFADFDYAILAAIHRLAEACGYHLTPAVNFISLLAWRGVGLILFSVILMAFRRTRWLGVCAFGGLCFGTIFTNFVLKFVVDRVRPYDLPQYFAWWQAVGGLIENGTSFPSGHVTAATAVMTGFFLTSKRKKKTWPVFLFALLMMFSRVYLVVHYPTDVIGGALAGVAAAFCSLGVTLVIRHFITAYDNAFCRFVREFDVVAFFAGLRKKDRSAEPETVGQAEAEDNNGNNETK